MATKFVVLACFLAAALADSAFFLGLQGESCAATCGRQGRTCIPAVPINTSSAEAVYKQLNVSCRLDERPWWAADQPNVVTDPSDPNYGDCLGWKDTPPTILCQGAFHAVRRVCFCGDDDTSLPFFGTGYSGGVITPNETTMFYHLVEDGSTGVMDHFWTTAPGNVLDGSIFRYYVDGEATASIEFTPGMACGVGFNDSFAPWGTKWFGVGAGNGQGTAYTLNFNIPFTKSIRFTVQHESGTHGGFYVIVRGAKNKQVNIGGVALPPTARLWLQKFDAVVPAMTFVPITSIASGRGMHFMHTLAVSSGNLNFLEGCYHAYTGNTKTFPGIVLSTGTEDYFDSGWYFNAGQFHYPVSGFTHLTANSSLITWSAYRFHEMDPLVFEDGFELVWRNGDMVDRTTGLKCYTESGGDPAGAPTASHVMAYGWIYTWQAALQQMITL